jgi:hypothetical protein
MHRAKFQAEAKRACAVAALLAGFVAPIPAWARESRIEFDLPLRAPVAGIPFAAAALKHEGEFRSIAFSDLIRPETDGPDVFSIENWG